VTFYLAERAQIIQAKRNVNKDPIIHIDNTELILNTNNDEIHHHGHHHQHNTNDNNKIGDDLTLMNNKHNNIINSLDNEARVVTTSNIDVEQGPCNLSSADYSWFRGVHTESTLIVYKVPMQGWNTIAVEGQLREKICD